MFIESIKNQRIKNILKLQQKSRERKSQGLFVVEGIQENELALKGNFIPKEFYICEEIYSDSIQIPEKIKFSITKEIFEKLAYRKTTGGIIGIFETKCNALEDLKLNKDSLLVILESIEKPGNLGAVLRTSDGAGVSAVIVCDSQVDFYNPNVIRSSVGTVFTNNLISTSKEELVNFCKENQIQIVSTFLREETQDLYETDLSKKTALVMGTESNGLSDFWAENSDVLIKIPMNGMVDSLNVSNAAAICIYEAYRQKLAKR